MKKYFLIISNSYQEFFTYRLNFLLWRLRVIISILITFFLWQTIFLGQKQLFGYNEAQMLTYILLITFINGIVLSTQTFRVAEEINFGKLSSILVRPLNYFGYILAKDFSDKSLNTLFSLVELLLLVFIFKPPLVFQTNISWILLFIIAVVLAAFLYFEIGMILSFIGFWSKETWAPRFVFFILVTFLAGIYFPLDIVPPPIYNILQLLPFTYLVFFPLKIYLGTISWFFIIKGFLITFFWIIILYFVMRFLWRLGLKTYTGEGI